MSKRHPNNGPSLSAAPPQKHKPPTDEELADRQARQRVGDEQRVREAAKSRAVHKALNSKAPLGALRALRDKND